MDIQKTMKAVRKAVGTPVDTDPERVLFPVRTKDGQTGWITMKEALEKYPEDLARWLAG